MNENQALDLLVQVAKLAQARGVLTLDEAVLVAQAVKVFTPEKPVNEQTVNEPEVVSPEITEAPFNAAMKATAAKVEKTSNKK